MTAAALSDNPRRVIIAMDGSDHSEYAFTWYLENVHRPGNRVIVVFCPEYKGLVHSYDMGHWVPRAPTHYATLYKNLKQETRILRGIKTDAGGKDGGSK